MYRSFSLPTYWLGVVIMIAACACAYAAAAFVQVGSPTAMTMSTECYARLQERYAADALEPIRVGRVLYVGGSSGFYGVRCGRLSDAVGRPARNLGLHAGLGLRYLLDRALTLAAPGDLIVVGLEWEIYRGPRFGEYACDYLMSRRPEYIGDLSLSNYCQLILSAGPARVLTGLVRKLVRSDRECENHDTTPAVNAFGDRVLSDAELAQHPEKESGYTGVLARWQSPPDDIVSDVARFARLSERKGVRVVVVFPPMCVAESPDSDVMREVSDGLRALWGHHGVPLVGAIENSFYGPQQAFDTPYHLREPAAIIHTQRLANDLRSSGIVE
jgi:hypothetical protein